MITTISETTHYKQGPHCTREQAARLLEELRAAYQSLSVAERGLVKGVIGKMARVEVMQEYEQEIECCE